MGIVIDGGISDMAKTAIETKLQGLFYQVFKHGRPLGRFNFRSQTGWKDYYEALQKEKILRGVWICRIPKGEIPWFPVYHFIDDAQDHSEIKSPEGSNKYSYIATR